MLRRLDDLSLRNVVLDFARTDYFGSHALEFFIRVWKKVCCREGRMALCNVSAHEAEILRLTKPDSSWPICPCREAALQFVRGMSA